MLQTWKSALSGPCAAAPERGGRISVSCTPSDSRSQPGAPNSSSARSAHHAPAPILKSALRTTYAAWAKANRPVLGAVQLSLWVYAKGH